MMTAIAADHIGRPLGDDVTADDIRNSLSLVQNERQHLDAAEVALIEAALDRGVSLTNLAEDYGYSRQALTKRYYTLGGTRSPLRGDPAPAQGTVVRYLAAGSEADVHGEEAVEVVLDYVDSICAYRPRVPARLGGDRIGGSTWYGELPKPGKTSCGKAYSDGDTRRSIEIWIRAETQAEEQK